MEVDRELRAWPALHARLALIEAGGPPPVAARVERTGPLFWVTAALDDPPPGILRAAAPARYLVRPGEWPGRAAAFTVAGCQGYRLDRRGVRRAA